MTIRRGTASIKAASPAGEYLLERQVRPADFNQYGTRRGNHEVMMRGTFANIRIKNFSVKDAAGVTPEGGYAVHYPSAEKMFIYDAAMRYEAEGVPLVIFAGVEYGNGSSRDWAAKGTNLLGVKAVITKSFERIHRSNLVGMGVLPCNFVNKDDYEKVKDLADATFDILGIDNDLKPMQQATLRVHKADGSTLDLPIVVRIDTPVEKDYYRAGGILPYVLAQILA
jgi:aconitate hydratase